MPTKEQTIDVDEAFSSKLWPKNLDRTPETSKFIFEAALSTAVAANGKRPTKAPQPDGPLTPEMLGKMDRYWRAANYLCIGQIYLFENPLLREPLKAEQIKPRLLGHWGTSPGQNLILHSSEPPHQKARCQHHLYCRSGTWRSIAQCQLLSRRHLYRSPSGDYAR
ncbi:MAG: hypothetical protein WCF22_16785 [Candidatus Sulfotelmatobacter sp.]